MLKRVRIVSTFAAALLLGAPGAHAQAFNDVLGIIAPIAPGAYPVGCSNVEQDFSRVMGGGAVAYWEGRGGSGTGYVTDLLVDPAHAFIVDVPLPDDRDLYGDFRNRSVTYANLVC